jgi:hypothetical protein
MTTPQDLLSPEISPADEVEPSQELADVAAGEVAPQKLTIASIAGLRITKPTVDVFINALIYGDPGGKTRFAGSASLVPEMCPVLLLDFEGGTLSLATDMPDVELWPDRESGERPDWAAMVKLYNWLYDKNPYKTIIVDSVTEVQKFCMGQVMREVVAKNSERDPDVPSVREWGKSGEQLRRLVRGLRDLHCNTIYTALRNDEKDDNGKIIKTYPGLPGQLKGEVSGYVDLVGYMYQKEVVRGGERSNQTLLLTQGTEKQIAKDRSGQLPPIMVAPTMQQVYDSIHGKRETENASESV